jgi:hypothetical protein
MSGFGGYGKQNEQPRVDRAQRDRALELLKHGWVRFNHQPNGPYHMVVVATARGMIELFDMEGEFAPHLFVPAPPPGE